MKRRPLTISISDAESTSVHATQDLDRPSFPPIQYLPKLPRDDPRVWPRFCHHGSQLDKKHFLYIYILKNKKSGPTVPDTCYRSNGWDKQMIQRMKTNHASWVLASRGLKGPTRLLRWRKRASINEVVPRCEMRLTWMFIRVRYWFDDAKNIVCTVLHSIFLYTVHREQSIIIYSYNSTVFFSVT